MRSLFRNTDAPFDTLPHETRRVLTLHGVWTDPVDGELPADWEIESILRELTFAELERWHHSMVLHRAKFPCLYKQEV